MSYGREKSAQKWSDLGRSTDAAFFTHGSPVIQRPVSPSTMYVELLLVGTIWHLFLLLLDIPSSSTVPLSLHSFLSHSLKKLSKPARPASARTLEFTSQSDMDEPLPDRSRTPTIQLRPLPIPTLRSPHAPPRSRPDRNRSRSPSPSCSPVSSERHISTLVAESLRLDFDHDEDDLPLHIEFSASQDRERPSLLASSFAALASYSTSRPSTPSPQRNTSRDYNPGDYRSYSPNSDLLEEEDSFIDSLDPLFEPYAESSVAIIQSPSAQMPSSPHRRLYPDQSGGSPPSSPLAQRFITRPSPMRRDASNSVPDGTINPFMGGWEVTNSPAASSRSSQRGGHIEYYAGAPLRPGPVTARAPESDDVKGNDDVDAPDLKSSEEMKSPSTKILIFHMSLTMTWDVSRLPLQTYFAWINADGVLSVFDPVS